MVLTMKARQQNMSFLSQIEEFEECGTIGDLVSRAKQNAELKDGLTERQFMVVENDSFATTNEKTLKIHLLEWSFIGGVAGC